MSLIRIRSFQLVPNRSLNSMAKRRYANANWSAVAERMKEKESQFENVLNSTQPFVIRLDGHRFSRFVSVFDKPFDARINYAMMSTSVDLMKQFNAACSYTESDEISLIFPPNENNVDYKGRATKLVTLASGYCSSRFNYHMLSVLNPSDEKLYNRVREMEAHFDARVFHLSDMEECVENIKWRMSDSKRNSVSRIGQHFYAQKVINGVSTEKLLAKLERDQIFWHKTPEWFKFGVIIKRKKVMRVGVDPRSGESINTDRTSFASTGASILTKSKPSESAQLFSLKNIVEGSPYYNLFEGVPEVEEFKREATNSEWNQSKNIFIVKVSRERVNE
eukprot:TRINITY_DN6767_c0_g1_i2.p1 TRINITY_DN6767_c0_g1~~TRINITY_DN6767_c0_g1_i2.p1  ORF type:complete len:334 (-),score=99.24 TRINITY_DN6767_c0_g1_i2:135-1136(-)